MSEEQPEEQSAPAGNDDNPGPHEDNENIMNLFASVWVKCELTEVTEEEENETKSDEPDEDETETKNIEPKEDFNPTSITQKRPCKKRPPKPKNLKCDQCDYVTNHKNCLTIHVLGHSDSKPLICNLCDYKTRYPASLKRHVFVKHECEDDASKMQELPIYKCSVCPYETHYKCNLASHQRKHNLDKQFKCPHCDYSTAYKHNYMKHCRTHNKPVEATYYCDKCPFTAKHQGHITRHLAKIHLVVSEKATKCEHCPFSTRVKWRLNIHKNRSRQEEPIKCTHCEYQSIYRCAYREHKKVHTGATRSNPQWLASMFTKDSNAQDQNVQLDFESTKEEQALEVMKMCEIRSKLDDCANQNRGVHFYDELKNKFNEEPIYYTLNSTNVKTDKHSLDNIFQQSEHEKTYHYFVDPTCDVQWGNIRVIESPDLERPFQCIACDHKAKFKASVQRHYQRHHSDNRPYKCINCDFSTKTKDKITLHSKRSKTDEILTCKNCEFTSMYKCQFSMHEKVHYPYKCVYCEYTCKKKNEMQKHFTMVHLGIEFKNLTKI